MYRLISAILLSHLASPLAADTWEDASSRFCRGAKTSTWEAVSNFAASARNIPIAEAFRDVRCNLSVGNSDNYVGNMWQASIRLNPNARDLTLNISRHFLKDNPNDANRQVFVSLVRGVGVDHGVFHQIRSTWRINNGRRDIAMHAARIICMSIDRYDIEGLYDIRQNECATLPFVEPWRLP